MRTVQKGNAITVGAPRTYGPRAVYICADLRKGIYPRGSWRPPLLMHKCVNVVSLGISDLCEFHQPVRVCIPARPRFYIVQISDQWRPIRRPFPNLSLPELLNRSRGGLLSTMINRGYSRSVTGPRNHGSRVKGARKYKWNFNKRDCTSAALFAV